MTGLKGWYRPVGGDYQGVENRVYRENPADVKRRATSSLNPDLSLGCGDVGPRTMARNMERRDGDCPGLFFLFVLLPADGDGDGDGD